MKRARFFFAFLVVAMTVAAVFAFNVKREKFRAETIYYHTFTVYYPIPCIVSTINNCTFARPYYRKVGNSYVLYTGPAMAI
jgi:hypothetical protein